MDAPTPERTKALADGLYQDGWYSQAKEIDALGSDRDAAKRDLWSLICAVNPFLQIEEKASYSFGQIKDSDIARLRKAHSEACLHFKPKDHP
jgi:hypothetical protein